MTTELYQTYHFWFNPHNSGDFCLYKTREGIEIKTNGVASSYIEKDKPYTKEFYIGCFEAAYVVGSTRDGKRSNS